MNQEEKYNYWLDIAEYDIDPTEAMLNTGRYPSFKEKISQLVNEEQAKKILNDSKEAFAWLKSLKK